MPACRKLQRVRANFPAFSLCEGQIIPTLARHEAFDTLGNVRFALVVLVDELHRHESTIYDQSAPGESPKESTLTGQSRQILTQAVNTAQQLLQSYVRRLRCRGRPSG